MSRPKVDHAEVARIARPGTRNTQPAALVVEVCTLEPPGAPAYVRPRYVSLALERPNGDTVTIGIRKRELDAVIAALQAARSQL